MSEKKLKTYAIIVIVKPIGYSRKTFKGMSIAFNSKEAKEESIQQIIKAFDSDDSPDVNRDVITVKECKLYSDFITVTK